jgi:hypothetical protein
LTAPGEQTFVNPFHETNHLVENCQMLRK